MAVKVNVSIPEVDLYDKDQSMSTYTLVSYEDQIWIESSLNCVTNEASVLVLFQQIVEKALCNAHEALYFAYNFSEAL